MKLNDCIFCQVLAEEVPSSKVYQDELVAVFMDLQPVIQGLMLVIPNVHAPYLADIDPETGAQMFKVAQKLSQALRRSGVKCEGINSSKQEVFHCHLHVFPRYLGDGFVLNYSR